MTCTGVSITRNGVSHTITGVSNTRMGVHMSCKGASNSFYRVRNLAEACNSERLVAQRFDHRHACHGHTKSLQGTSLIRNTHPHRTTIGS